MADAAAAEVFSDPLDVAPRLVALGLTEDPLLDAVRNGVEHASACTAHDPPMMPGLLRWGKTMRHLRDRLVPLGWRADNTNNFSTVVSPNGEWGIGASSGDENTGRHSRVQPRTKNPKGNATRDITNRNQMSFADIVPEFLPESVNIVSRTWLLLFHHDRGRSEVRAELSLPDSMDIEGRVTSWHIRLILNPIRGSEGELLVEYEAPDDDIDFDVERRVG